MKLLDILNEKIEIPKECKIELSSLKKYIFEDWQTFNQKLVPSFKTLRNRIIKEKYSNVTAKNNLMNVVEFAIKKYVAENTDRKYSWNHVFPKNERYELVRQLVEFFETYNLNDKLELLTEESDAQREASISFDSIELEVVNNKPIMAFNFKYDNSTTNFIINMLGRNKTLKLSDFDLQTLNGLVTFRLEDVTSGNRLSYLKFHSSNSSVSRTDLKHLNTIHNRRVILEIIEVPVSEPEIQNQPTEPNSDEVETEPITPEPIPTQAPEIKRPQDVVSDKELKEIVNNSIKKVLGE